MPGPPMPKKAATPPSPAAQQQTRAKRTAAAAAASPVSTTGKGQEKVNSGPAPVPAVPAKPAPAPAADGPSLADVLAAIQGVQTGLEAKIATVVDSVDTIKAGGELLADSLGELRGQQQAYVEELDKRLDSLERAPTTPPAAPRGSDADRAARAAAFAAGLDASGGPPEPGETPICAVSYCSLCVARDDKGLPLDYCGPAHADEHRVARKSCECCFPGCRLPRRKEGTVTHRYCGKKHAREDKARAAQFCLGPGCRFGRLAGQSYCGKTCCVNDAVSPGGGKWHAAPVDPEIARREKARLRRIEIEDAELAGALAESQRVQERLEAAREHVRGREPAGSGLSDGRPPPPPGPAESDEVRKLREELAELRAAHKANQASESRKDRKAAAADDSDAEEEDFDTYCPHYFDRAAAVFNPHRPLRRPACALRPHQYKISRAESEYVKALGKGKKNQVLYEYLNLCCVLSYYFDANAYLDEVAEPLSEGSDFKADIVRTLQNQHREQYAQLLQRKNIIELRCRVYNTELSHSENDAAILGEVERRMAAFCDSEADLDDVDPKIAKIIRNFKAKSNEHSFKEAAKVSGQANARARSASHKKTNQGKAPRNDKARGAVPP